MSLMKFRETQQVCQERIVRSIDGRIIGRIEGQTFVKPVCGSRHQLKSPPAWAVDAEAFDQHVKPRCSLLRVEDRETNTVYETPVAYFDQHKGEFDRGFGRQYFLVLSKWEVRRNGNGAKQLKLWQEVGA